MSNRIFVWDLFTRLFHWLLVIGFAANALYTDKESTLHHWVGYFVVSIVSLRIIWGMVGSKYARFKSFPPSLRAAQQQLAEMLTSRRNVHLGHSPLGALMIYNLLLSMIAIGATGFMMTTYTYFGVEWVENAHELCVTWAEISIIFHILAVLFESWRLRINLPKAMITGYKKIDKLQE